MLQRNIKKQPKTCSVATRRKLFRGIMRAWNPFILLSSVEWLNRFKIRDYKQAYRLIFEYLEAFYNMKRIHRHCDFMSPDEFERVYKRAHIKAELLAG